MNELQRDIEYYLKQSNADVEKTLAQMTAILASDADKLEKMNKQAVFSRMWNTVTGNNKVTVKEIECNRDKIHSYITKIISELHKRERIPHGIQNSLAQRINNVAESTNFTKLQLEKIAIVLNNKIDSVDHSHLLFREIDSGKFGKSPSIFNFIKIVSQFDAFTCNNQRKLDNFKDCLTKSGILSDKIINSENLLKQVSYIAIEDVGQISIELQNYRNNKTILFLSTFVEEVKLFNNYQDDDIVIQTAYQNALKQCGFAADFTFQLPQLYDDIIAEKRKSFAEIENKAKQRPELLEKNEHLGNVSKKTINFIAKGKFDIVASLKSKAKEKFLEVMGYSCLRQVLKAEYYDFYIQNAFEKSKFGDTKVNLIMASGTDNEHNLQFLENNKNQILLLEGVNKPNSFLVIKVHQLAAKKSVKNSVAAKIRFYDEHDTEAASIPRNQGFIPQNIMDEIENMSSPVMVKTNENYIADWNSYLEIIEKEAVNSKIEMKYKGYRQSDDFKYCSFHLEKFGLEMFKKLEKLKDERIFIGKDNEPSKDDEVLEDIDKLLEIGSLYDINFEKQIVKVELTEKFKNTFKKGEPPFEATGIFKSSKFGDEVQVKRLKFGLEKLKHNKRLSSILFECEKISGNIENSLQLPEDDFLTSTLNNKQKDAVKGVLNAKDYFLIQGPPGTGKTTVIAEICYQNAKLGKKTLISSQSNLAVDNALSKLAYNFKKSNGVVVRALRKGRISSVEDEGMKYTEDEVVNTWLSKTAETCESCEEYQEKKKLLKKVTEIEKNLGEISSKDQVITAKINLEIENLAETLSLDTDFKKVFDAVEKAFSDDKVNIAAAFGKFTDFVKKHVSNKNIIGSVENIFMRVQKILSKTEEKHLLKERKKCDMEILQEIIYFVKIFKFSEIKKICESNAFLIDNAELMRAMSLMQDEKHRILTNRLFELNKRESEINKIWNELDNLRKENGIAKVYKGKNMHSVNIDTFRVNVQAMREQKPLNFLIIYKTKLSEWKGKVVDKIEETIACMEAISAEVEAIKAKKNIIENEDKMQDSVAKFLERVYAVNANIIQEIKIIENEIANDVVYADIHTDYLKIKRDYYLDFFKTEKVKLSKYTGILNEWVNYIREKKYEKQEELKQLYINAVNVVGITCVQSAGKDFTEQYPDFDVVIVDEVSKATPPELVLPMLKGKKIVLVGDHKQLPPMIDDKTLEEIKKKQQTDSDELEAIDLEHMKKSLFETMYENTDPKNKIMLDTQYRMHSSIMKTINQFYEDKENFQGLNSGVDDSKKQHGLDTGYIKPNKHLLWVDVPLNAKFFEKQKHQKSYCNEYEVNVVKQILHDINESAVGKHKKQEVAIITFYSAQKKLLNELYEQNTYQNLELRVGTVDRFQGMEREIVIVSFVRNNNEGKIGFAQDPKRINVALSRAENLLIIVGSSELFCYRAKSKASAIYTKVLDVVKNNNGLLNSGRILKEVSGD